MLTAAVVRGAVAASGALVAAVLVAALPAQGAPGGAAVAAGSPTATGTPTATPTPPPIPTPTVTTTPTAPAPTNLLPDLVALPASAPTVQVRDDGLRLRFTSSLGNVGLGPIEVRPNQNQPCPAGQHNSTQILYLDDNGNGRFNPRHDTGITRHRAGCMVYHPLHHHWHFKASARYTLLGPAADGTQARVVVSARRKVSFCLRDSARVPTRYGAFDHPQAYSVCGRRSPQGISVGWMDVYQSVLAGQSLRLPDDLGTGLYCLRTVVDPLNQLVESDDSNNVSVRALSIRGNSVAVSEAVRCR